MKTYDTLKIACSPDQDTDIIAEHAQQGWQLVSVVACRVKRAGLHKGLLVQGNDAPGLILYFTREAVIDQSIVEEAAARIKDRMVSKYTGPR